jgi:hypothetical protein
MTGRKMGFCVGNDTPGYTSSPGGYGRGRGFGGGYGRGDGGFGFRRRFAWNDPNAADRETVPNWFEQEFHKLKEQVLDLQKRFSDSGK